MSSCILPFLCTFEIGLYFYKFVFVFSLSLVRGLTSLCRVTVVKKKCLRPLARK